MKRIVSIMIITVLFCSSFALKLSISARKNVLASEKINSNNLSMTSSIPKYEPMVVIEDKSTAEKIEASGMIMGTHAA